MPISGIIKNQQINGQVDRLIVQENEVIILDYKTGTPPENHNDISEQYINQMNIYRKIIKKIYPNKKVICYLLWTQNMIISKITDK